MTPQEAQTIRERMEFYDSLQSRIDWCKASSQLLHDLKGQFLFIDHSGLRKGRIDLPGELQGKLRNWLQAELSREHQELRDAQLQIESPPGTSPDA